MICLEINCFCLHFWSGVWHHIVSNIQHQNGTAFKCSRCNWVINCSKTNANTSVHSYFILFALIWLSESTVAPSMLLPLPSRDETWIGAPNGVQYIQYGAVKLGTAQDYWALCMKPFVSVVLIMNCDLIILSNYWALNFKFITIFQLEVPLRRCFHFVNLFRIGSVSSSHHSI